MVMFFEEFVKNPSKSIIFILPVAVFFGFYLHFFTLVLLSIIERIVSYIQPVQTWTSSLLFLLFLIPALVLSLSFISVIHLMLGRKKQGYSWLKVLPLCIAIGVIAFLNFILTIVELLNNPTNPLRGYAWGGMALAYFALPFCALILFPIFDNVGIDIFTKIARRYLIIGFFGLFIIFLVADIEFHLGFFAYNEGYAFIATILSLIFSLVYLSILLPAIGIHFLIRNIQSENLEKEKKEITFR